MHIRVHINYLSLQRKTGAQCLTDVMSAPACMMPSKTGARFIPDVCPASVMSARPDRRLVDPTPQSPGSSLAGSR